MGQAGCMCPNASFNQCFKTKFVGDQPKEIKRSFQLLFSRYIGCLELYIFNFYHTLYSLEDTQLDYPMCNNNVYILCCIFWINKWRSSLQAVSHQIRPMWKFLTGCHLWLGAIFDHVLSLTGLIENGLFRADRYLGRIQLIV